MWTPGLHNPGSLTVVSLDSLNTKLEQWEETIIFFLILQMFLAQYGRQEVQLVTNFFRKLVQTTWEIRGHELEEE